MDTFSQVQEVIRSVFDDPELAVSRRTTPWDIESWDSVMHVTVLLEVQSRLRLHFSLSEMAYLKDVGDLVNLIDSKQQARRSVEPSDSVS